MAAQTRTDSQPEVLSISGPTRGSGNILLLNSAGHCVGTVKHSPDADALCRQRAARWARTDVRTAILQHLLAEMESDESRWGAEIAMVRDELKATGDDADT